MRPVLPRAWVLVPVLVLAVTAVYPLLLLAGQSLHPDAGHESALGAWVSVLSNPAFGTAVLTTLEIAAVATALSVLLGVFIALVLYFAPLPGTRTFINVLAVYLSFPSFLIILALIFVYGNAGIVQGSVEHLTGATLDMSWLQSRTGVILAEVTYFTPFVIGPVYAALQLLNPAHLDVARVMGASLWRTLWRVVLPEIGPALAGVSALVLVRTMNEFGIILFASAKGVTTLPMLVYDQAIARGNLDNAAVVAVVNVVVSAMLYAVYLKLTKRQESRI